MRIKKDFVLREIAGDYVIVPVGESMRGINGIISVNEVGALLWKCLQQEQTEADLIKAVLDEYDVSEENARDDIREFLDEMRKNDLI